MFIQPMEPSAAARQDKARGDLAVKAGALPVVANERKQFHGARLDDVRQHVREDGSWRTVAYAGNLNRAVSLHESGRGAAVAALDSFRFGGGCAQAVGQIIREVIAANGNRAGVTHHAAAED